MLVVKLAELSRCSAVLLCVPILFGTTASSAAPSSPSSKTAHPVRRAAHHAPVAARALIDHSGQLQKGRASYYGRQFTNRRMADGDRFDPKSRTAASKTLPLGTTAKVTNLENGRSATVRIVDRGPLAVGRVVDLSPLVADELRITQRGVAPVVVAPIAVPQRDGTVRVGAGAQGATPREIAEAKHQTEEAMR